MPNLKLSETQEPVRSARLKYVDIRGEQLLRLVEESELRTLKYLTLSNAGGAAATLSFLGASEKARLLLLPKFSLSLFIIGVVLVGVLNALSTHKMSNLFHGWKHDSNKYISNESTWGALRDEDEDRVQRGRCLIICIAYISFFCFIAGAFVGLWALFSS
ncbi:MAG: hypothetical protein PVG66_07770 [Chromatiales bacterium]|jgi:hypothetical protein